jgi:ribokinase
MDWAAELGCVYIDVWPGQDGFDYCFQADYIEAWKWLTDGLAECAAHNDKVKILVEYKPKEPRTHCFVSHVGKVLLLLKDIDSIGVLLDWGHALEGGDFIMAPGGKGANQAVAAAKLGVDVLLVAKLGNDIFGSKSLENFQCVGVDTKNVTQTNEAPSGVALIMVDEGASNSIVVAPGANSKLLPADVDRAKSDITSSGAVVAQLEVPLETVGRAAKLAEDSNVPFILDPAPAQKLSTKLLAMVDVLTPNETEAQILTGTELKDEDSARETSEQLLETGGR